MVAVAQVPTDEGEFVDVESYLDSLVAEEEVKVVKSAAEESSEGLKELVSDEDSVRIAKEVSAEGESNPLFMDWVFTEDEIVENDDEISSLRNEAKAEVRASNPELFRYHEDQLPDPNDLGLRTPKNKSLEAFLLKQEMKAIPQIVSIHQQKKKWTWDGRLSVLMTQSYVSKNWYKGGYSNLSLLSRALCNVNYSNLKNFIWENRFEWKAGFNSSASDSLRWVQTNEDLLRVSSKIGVKVSKSWYSSLSGEFNTTLFNTFVQNSHERSTAPFSPIQFYLSLGMEYKYKKMLTVSLMPFSYKLTYCMDTSHPDGAMSVAEKFNIPDGKHMLHKIGSRVQVDFVHAFSKELRLESKFYAYTDYKDVEIDWEITGNFIATSFLTIQCSLHPRYDSSLVLAEGQKHKFQFREFVSLGFLYVF